MKKPKNRPKPRRTSGTSRARQEAAPPQGISLVGRASCPSPTPSPPPSLPSDPSALTASLNDAQKTDLLLRLWEDPTFALADIASLLGLAMPELLELLRRPDIADLLEQMGELLDRRMRHIAAKAASRAMDTLEQVQTEAAQAATSTPVSPEAIQADRRAATSRNQRRLAASAALAHHRALRTPPKPLRIPKAQATAGPFQPPDAQHGTRPTREPPTKNYRFP